MPMLRNDEQKKVTNFQYGLSIGLFLVTLLMWLYLDTGATAVLLTGAAALTVIINRYQNKEEKDFKKGYRA